MFEIKLKKLFIEEFLFTFKNQLKADVYFEIL